MICFSDLLHQKEYGQRAENVLNLKLQRSKHFFSQPLFSQCQTIELK